MSDRTVRWSGRLPATLPKRLKIEAAQTGTTIGELIETLLDERVARRERAARLAPSPLHAGAVLHSGTADAAE